jgi:hypothetical protein
MLISVFDLWILIDRCNLCVLTVHCGGTSRYNTCKNHLNTGSPCAITFKRKPTTMSWNRCCFKKNHVSYVLQINTNIKFTIKYTPFSTQHVLITRWERVQLDALRKQTETNITTRNCCPSWTSQLSIMNIVASTMTLQTNCRDQTFISIGTFHELQSVSMMEARKWRNPSCLDCTFLFKC